MYNYIVNPCNKKKYFIHSRIGKKIIKLYLKNILGGNKPMIFNISNNDIDVYDLDIKGALLNNEMGHAHGENNYSVHE